MNGNSLKNIFYLLNEESARRQRSVPTPPIARMIIAINCSTIGVNKIPNPVKRTAKNIARSKQIAVSLALLAAECDFSKLVFAMITLL